MDCTTLLMVMIALDEPLPEPSQQVCIESSSARQNSKAAAWKAMVWAYRFGRTLGAAVPSIQMPANTNKAHSTALESLQSSRRHLGLKSRDGRSTRLSCGVSTVRDKCAS